LLACSYRVKDSHHLQHQDILVQVVTNLEDHQARRLRRIGRRERQEERHGLRAQHSTPIDHEAGALKARIERQPAWPREDGLVLTQ